jgi:hypothetical protein
VLRTTLHTDLHTAPRGTLRQLLLVAFMACLLFGAQLAQSSPLHDHTKHSVDCALCHLQLGDDVQAQSSPGVAFIAHDVPYVQQLREFHSSRNPSPYSGRAPPALLR